MLEANDRGGAMEPGRLLVEMPSEGTEARPVNRERLVANLKKLPEMPEIP